MSKSAYEAWKDKTLAYYASQGVEMSELEDLDTDERLKSKDCSFFWQVTLHKTFS